MVNVHDDEDGAIIHKPTMVSAAALAPAAYNPNKMRPEEYEALKESIREHGFAESVTVQKTGMRIIAGHHRVRAVREIAIESGAAIPEIPCIVLDVDDAAAKRLNLKLQHIHGSPDAHMIGELLLDIHREHAFDPDESLRYGFALDDVMKYMRVIEPDLGQIVDAGARDPVPSFGRSPTLALEFETEAGRDAVKKLLAERTDVEKKKSGDVVAFALGLGVKRKPAATTKPIPGSNKKKRARR